MAQLSVAGRGEILFGYPRELCIFLLRQAPDVAVELSGPLEFQLCGGALLLAAADTVHGRQEIVDIIGDRYSASRNMLVDPALALLPLGSPKPRLIGRHSYTRM
jgi:hypothetical protein